MTFLIQHITSHNVYYVILMKLNIFDFTIYINNWWIN
jgi:hypothetical protein